MKVIRSISVMLLAILLLVSSTSFVFGVHYCMGEVQSISLFGKTDSCPKEKEQPPCHKHMKPACCEDETVVHEGIDFKASLNLIHIDAPAPMDIDQPLVLIAEVIPDAPIARIQYYRYDPPLRTSDLTAEHQVLLI